MNKKIRNHKLKKNLVKDSTKWKDGLGVLNQSEASSRRITRSITRFLEYINKNFDVVELYRCMPLLGDEEDVPNWDVHIVHYCVVFLNSDEYYAFQKNYRV